MTTLEKMGKLPTTFKKGGVVTAASASGICDGAGALVLASEAAVREHAAEPLTWLPILPDANGYWAVGVDAVKVGGKAVEGQTANRIALDTGSSLTMAPFADVNGVLDMLANWRLDSLQAQLPRLQLPLWLAAGLSDRTVAPVRSLELARRLRHARFVPLQGLGHLAHEEAPEVVNGLLMALWDHTRHQAAADV